MRIALADPSRAVQKAMIKDRSWRARSACVLRGSAALNCLSTDNVKKKKPAVTREQAYAFARGCIQHGIPEPAAVAVIYFERLQRPENVLAGYLRWTDYRSREWPNAIRIQHHKTEEFVWHPLEETIDGDEFRRSVVLVEVLATAFNRWSKPNSLSELTCIVSRMI